MPIYRIHRTTANFNFNIIMHKVSVTAASGQKDRVTNNLQINLEKNIPAMFEYCRPSIVSSITNDIKTQVDHKFPIAKSTMGTILTITRDGSSEDINAFITRALDSRISMLFEQAQDIRNGDELGNQPNIRLPQTRAPK